MHFFNPGSKMVASKTRGGGREIDEAQAGQQFGIFLLQPPPGAGITELYPKTWLTKSN